MDLHYYFVGGEENFHFLSLKCLRWALTNSFSIDIFVEDCTLLYSLLKMFFTMITIINKTSEISCICKLLLENISLIWRRSRKHGSAKIVIVLEMRSKIASGQYIPRTFRWIWTNFCHRTFFDAYFFSFFHFGQSSKSWKASKGSFQVESIICIGENSTVIIETSVTRRFTECIINFTNFQLWMIIKNRFIQHNHFDPNK